jgi:glycosyltransferase involved in cell wall biosynthesis
MNVTFLLDDTAIAGRARTALAQADALIARGHRVRIATTGAPVTWRASRAEWLYVDDFSAIEDEIVVAEPPAGFEIVDAEVYRASVPRENEPVRVLLCGASQDEAKHLDDGYGAAAHARWFHQRFDLVRVSPWAPSRDEPLDAVQEFHVGLTAAEMTRLMHTCDAIIAPEERFSLSTAEALAAGLPAAMTHRDWDYGLSAPVDNAVELGERLIEILSDAELRDRLRKRGWAVAERWRAATVAARLEEQLAERRRPGGVPPP